MALSPGREGTVSDEQITPGEGTAAPGSAAAGGPSRRGLLKAGLVAGAVAGAGGWRPAPGNRGRHHHLRKPNSRPYPHLPAALAQPLLDTDPGALACNTSGPGTIPPPGSVTPPHHHRAAHRH